MQWTLIAICFFLNPALIFISLIAPALIVIQKRPQQIQIIVTQPSQTEIPPGIDREADGNEIVKTKTVRNWTVFSDDRYKLKITAKSEIFGQTIGTVLPRFGNLIIHSDNRDPLRWPLRSRFLYYTITADNLASVFGYERISITTRNKEDLTAVERFIIEIMTHDELFHFGECIRPSRFLKITSGI